MPVRAPPLPWSRVTIIYYNNQDSNVSNHESIHSIYVYITLTVWLHMSVLQNEYLFQERL